MPEKERKGSTPDADVERSGQRGKPSIAEAAIAAPLPEFFCDFCGEPLMHCTCWEPDDECDYEYSDEFDDAVQDCGMLADGTCMKAGSEECDWECPFGGMA